MLAEPAKDTEVVEVAEKQQLQMGAHPFSKQEVAAAVRQIAAEPVVLEATAEIRAAAAVAAVVLIQAAARAAVTEALVVAPAAVSV